MDSIGGSVVERAVYGERYNTVPIHLEKDKTRRGGAILLYYTHGSETPNIRTVVIIGSFFFFFFDMVVVVVVLWFS